MPLVNKNVNTIPAYKLVQGPVSCTDPYAFYFDGGNNTVANDAGDAIFDLASNMSISAWIQVDPAVIAAPVSNTLYMIADKATGPLSSGGSGYTLYLRQTGTATYVCFTVNVAGNSPSQKRAEIEITDSLTHHVVGTFNGGIGSELKMYVDGVLTVTPNNPKILTTPGLIPISAQDFCIGNTTTTPGNDEFDGKLDEISVWDKELVLAQVQTIYDFNTNCDLNALGYTGLIAWYRMGENATWNLPTPNEWTLNNAGPLAPAGQLISNGMVYADRVPGII